MKKTWLTVGLICFLPILVVGQTWESVEFPQDETVTGVCFVSEDTGFVVTHTGRVGRTVDGGKNWKLADVARGVILEDASFLNGSFGIVCGRNGALYRTNDGGRGWENKSLKDTIPWIYDVEMLDENHVIAIGSTRDPENPYTGLMLRSTDGGASWEPQESVGMGYNEIVYQANAAVYLMSFGRINISTDKGATWRGIPTLDGEAARTFSLHGKTAIIGGPTGVCAVSHDSGKNWTKIPQPENRSFVACEMIDAATAYMGGIPNILLKSTDAGRTWSEEEVPKPFNVLDLCQAGGWLWAVGSDGGVMRKRVK